ncbi:hypothetical protein DPMN_051866 [Dreissena polymorpha]|uniref:Uncharacterized protein n=1 Tax=Dreissena polymorpha TaxID=45954 RepID=A0A9D4HPA4_DREPO|nr:hypothetical protein DPMN_051866 [Dreissena polymorpha]
MLYGCKISPTGAVILTLYFFSSVTTSKVAGWVVSLKFTPISTDVEFLVAKAAVRKDEIQ